MVLSVHSENVLEMSFDELVYKQSCIELVYT